MADHAAEEAARQVPDHSRLLVLLLQVDAEHTLEPLKEDDRACVVKLVVKCFDDFLLERDQFLLLYLNVPFLLNEADHAVETGRNWLL